MRFTQWLFLIICAPALLWTQVTIIKQNSALVVLEIEITDLQENVIVVNGMEYSAFQFAEGVID